MDCVTASYAGAKGSSPTEKQQKFLPFSFIHNLPPPLSLFDHFFEGLAPIGNWVKNRF